MKKYNVQQISELLNVTPETVRRWIREGKINAKQTSKKEGNVGNVIEESDLQKFVEKVPKYAGVVAGMTSTLAPIGVSIAVAEMFGMGI